MFYMIGQCVVAWACIMGVLWLRDKWDEQKANRSRGVRGGELDTGERERFHSRYNNHL